MTVTFSAIEDEFNKLFRLLSARESMRNSRLMKQVQKMRIRLQAIKEEMQRRKIGKDSEVLV